MVQLYIQDEEASVSRPLKQLVGFQRINLQPGQKKTVTFAVAVNQLGLYNRNLDFVLEPGTIRVLIGSSSADIRLAGAFEITGETTPIAQKTFFGIVKVN